MLKNIIKKFLSILTPLFIPFEILKLFLLLLLILTFTSCAKSPVGPETKEIQLQLEDVLCTEAWVRLNAGNIQLPAKINLIKDGKNIRDINLTSRDTLIQIDSLQPKKTYKLTAKEISKNIESNELQITTIDTAGRNFIWQEWIFGGDDCGSSALLDVVIIDENNIWAVGDIKMQDSLGNCDPKAYNAVHWDGTKWELKRIKFNSFCPEGTGYGFYPARSVFNMDNENIVVSSGSSLAYLRNGKQIKRECVPVAVNKFWGRSSNDIYAVGDIGKIAHWDGVRWMKIESGTQINLMDVEKASNTIFVSGYNYLGGARSTLLEIKDNQVNKKWESQDLIYVQPYGTTITAIAGAKDYLYVASTKGFFKENVRLNTYPQKVTNMNFDWVYECEANDVNDVFTFSDEPEIYHYNGVDLKPIYKGPRMKLFYGGAVKGDIVVGVGTYYVDVFTAYALLVIGRRIK